MHACMCMLGQTYSRPLVISGTARHGVVALVHPAIRHGNRKRGQATHMIHRMRLIYPRSGPLETTTNMPRNENPIKQPCRAHTPMYSTVTHYNAPGLDLFS